jgi:hypothetical protein
MNNLAVSLDVDSALGRQAVALARTNTAVQIAVNVRMSTFSHEYATMLRYPSRSLR